LNTFEEVFRAADMSFGRVAVVSLRGVGCCFYARLADFFLT
jgi:hypothetical protein